MTPTFPSNGSSADLPSPDEWQSTRAQTVVATQLQPNKEDYLENGNADIGREVGGQRRELFVSCDPAEAMQQQFDHLRPEFIALHDLGTSSSRKLLAGVAAASGRAVQKLVVRRQGYGTSLATLEFIDFPGKTGSLRIYTTEADADTVARKELARVLLAYSRLGVVMVGDMPPHLLTSSLGALREAMITSTWNNRHLLLLPLAQSNTLVGQGSDMGRGTGVNVTTTPQVTRPADAWGFISGTWNRLREQLQATGLNLPALPGTNQTKAQPQAQTQAAPATLRAPDSPSFLTSRPIPSAPAALDMKPMPALRSVEAHSEGTLLSRYVNQLLELTGMVSCCVFDVSTGKGIAHAGARPGPDELGFHGATMLSGVSTASRALGLGHTLPDVAITLGTHHLLLRAVPSHPGLAMHAVLDKAQANLTLVRLQVARMDVLLEPPSR
ncbi:MAG TPA: hypothetical protein VE029_06785 [Rhizobacter sp.]|nr:hypothetical protein [Rhizobacter sp.]